MRPTPDFLGTRHCKARRGFEKAAPTLSAQTAFVKAIYGDRETGTLSLNSFTGHRDLLLRQPRSSARHPVLSSLRLSISSLDTLSCCRGALLRRGVCNAATCLWSRADFTASVSIDELLLSNSTSFAYSLTRFSKSSLSQNALCLTFADTSHLAYLAERTQDLGEYVDAVRDLSVHHESNTCIQLRQLANAHFPTDLWPSSQPSIWTSLRPLTGDSSSSARLVTRSSYAAAFV